MTRGHGKGASIYDVREIFGFFDPLPPCHCHNSADFVPFFCFLGTPLPPPTADVIYGSPLMIMNRDMNDLCGRRLTENGHTFCK